MDESKKEDEFMKKASIIILIVLVVAAFAFMGWKLYEINRYANDLDRTLSYVQGELTKAKKANSEAEMAVSHTEVSLTGAEEQIEDLEGDITDYKAQISDLDTQVADQLSQINSLEDKIFCKDSPKIDLSYTSNSTASDILKDYLGGIEGSVKTATWDEVWNDSKATVHFLTTNEGRNIFMVYFDEEDLGLEKGIFWADSQCWLEGE